MERISTDGGEHWIGFARSRIQALLLAGLGYARQSYNMPDGAEVMVGISDDAHTINIKLAADSIISGVVKEGKLIELPVPAGSPPGTKPKKKLKAFKATKDAAKKVLFRPAAADSFEDSRELATPLTTKKYFDDPKGLGSQVGAISAGMYSGEMRKVIQVLLGLKKQVEITYTYDFLDTYGVHKATDGSFWLIRIAKEHGVLAMPLGLSRANKSKSACKAEQECEKVFKGIPTGKDFPKDIEKAITDMKVLRLAKKDQIANFYKLKPYYPGCGWSFNNSGSEAHNTCFSPGGTSDQEYGCSYHYKITINITKQGNTLGLGYTGNAKLSVVNSYRLETYKIYEEAIPLPSITFPGYSPSGVGQEGGWSRGIKLFVKRAYDNPTIGPIYILVGHREDGSLFKAGYRGETEQVFAALHTTVMGDVVEDEEAFTPNIFATVEGEPKFGKWVGRSSMRISSTEVTQVVIWTSTNVKYAAAKWHHESSWWGGRLWHNYWPDYSGAVSIMDKVWTESGNIRKDVNRVRSVAFEGIHVRDYRSAFGASLTMLPGIRDSFVLLEKRPRHLMQDGNVTTYGQLHGYNQGVLQNPTYTRSLTPITIDSWDNDPFVTYPSGASLFYIGSDESSTSTVSRAYDIEPPPDPPSTEQPELFKLRMEPKSLANGAEEAIGSMCFKNNGREQLSIAFGAASMNYFGTKNTVLTFSTGSVKYPTKFRTIVSGDLVSELEKQPEKIESYFFVGCT